MEMWRIAVPVKDHDDARAVLALMRALRVRMDPCRGDPRFSNDRADAKTLTFTIDARALAALRETGRAFEIVRDHSKFPDPRTYVSKANRFADELARVRAAKGRR
jgi:hypothetical protein